MIALLSTHDANARVNPLKPKSAWRWCLGAILSVVLTACGGGGEAVDPASALEPSAARRETAKKQEANPTLMAQAVTLVNTTTAGDQNLRAMGALADGGYTVAWLSDTTLFMQRYDDAGNRRGGETAIGLVIDPRDAAAQIPATSSIGVLRDGSVVVAYSASRSSTGSPLVTETGVYMQRFDAAGAQVLAETRIVSMPEGDPRRPTRFGGTRVLPAPDGGYVVAWNSLSSSATLGLRLALFSQRFDASNQPVGGIINLGSTLNPTRMQILADAMGGYTVYLSGLREDFSPTGLNVTHYDASQTPTPILTGAAGIALLLPLDDGQYVLFTSQAEGVVYRQFLNSAGAAVGDRTAAPFMPISAQTLADGTYVLFQPTFAGGAMAQRFEASGEPIGDPLTLQVRDTLVVPLAEGGFAAGWSAADTGGGRDVYTQRFIEVADNPRKACLASAKGLRGQLRKAFMTACLR